MQMVFKFQVNWIKIEDFRNLADVDLLVYVDLFAYGNNKNNRWLFFGDLMCKWSSNFKLIG